MIRAGVCFHRRAIHQSSRDFMGDGEPARYIGTVIFDLARPPFKHRTLERETVPKNFDPSQARCCVPSRATVCYLVEPNRDAIDGALEEARQEQSLDSPGWAALALAVLRRSAP